MLTVTRVQSVGNVPNQKAAPKEIKPRSYHRETLKYEGDNKEKINALAQKKKEGVYDKSYLEFKLVGLDLERDKDEIVKGYNFDNFNFEKKNSGLSKKFSKLFYDLKETKEIVKFREVIEASDLSKYYDRFNSENRGDKSGDVPFEIFKYAFLEELRLLTRQAKSFENPKNIKSIYDYKSATTNKADNTQNTPSKTNKTNNTSTKARNALNDRPRTAASKSSSSLKVLTIKDNNASKTAREFFAKSKLAYQKALEDGSAHVLRMIDEQLIPTLSSGGALKNAQRHLSVSPFIKSGDNSELLGADGQPASISVDQFNTLKSIESAILNSQSNSQFGGKAEIRIPTGGGKTYLLGLVQENFKDVGEILSIDLNTSKNDLDRIVGSAASGQTIIIDEAYFLTDFGFTSDEKARNDFIQNLRNKGATVLISGASESLSKIEIEVRRLKDKISQQREIIEKKNEVGVLTRGKNKDVMTKALEKMRDFYNKPKISKESFLTDPKPTETKRNLLLQAEAILKAFEIIKKELLGDDISQYANGYFDELLLNIEKARSSKVIANETAESLYQSLKTVCDSGEIWGRFFSEQANHRIFGPLITSVKDSKKGPEKNAAKGIKANVAKAEEDFEVEEDSVDNSELIAKLETKLEVKQGQLEDLRLRRDFYTQERINEETFLSGINESDNFVQIVEKTFRVDAADKKLKKGERVQFCLPDYLISADNFTLDHASSVIQFTGADFVVVPNKTEQGLTYRVFIKNADGTAILYQGRSISKAELDEYEKGEAANLSSLTIFDKSNYIGGDTEHSVGVSENYFYVKNLTGLTNNKIMQGQGRARNAARPGKFEQGDIELGSSNTKFFFATSQEISLIDAKEQIQRNTIEDDDLHRDGYLRSKIANLRLRIDDSEGKIKNYSDPRQAREESRRLEEFKKRLKRYREYLGEKVEVQLDDTQLDESSQSEEQLGPKTGIFVLDENGKASFQTNQGREGDIDTRNNEKILEALENLSSCGATQYQNGKTYFVDRTSDGAYEILETDSEKKITLRYSSENNCFEFDESEFDQGNVEHSQISAAAAGEGLSAEDFLNSFVSSIPQNHQQIAESEKEGARKLFEVLKSVNWPERAEDSDRTSGNFSPLSQDNIVSINKNADDQGATSFAINYKGGLSVTISFDSDKNLIAINSQKGGHFQFFHSVGDAQKISEELVAVLLKDRFEQILKDPIAEEITETWLKKTIELKDQIKIKVGSGQERGTPEIEFFADDNVLQSLNDVQANLIENILRHFQGKFLERKTLLESEDYKKQLERIKSVNLSELYGPRRIDADGNLIYHKTNEFSLTFKEGTRSFLSRKKNPQNKFDVKLLGAEEVSKLADFVTAIDLARNQLGKRFAKSENGPIKVKLNLYENEKTYSVSSDLETITVGNTTQFESKDFLAAVNDQITKDYLETQINDLKEFAENAPQDKMNFFSNNNLLSLFYDLQSQYQLYSLQQQYSTASQKTLNEIQQAVSEKKLEIISALNKRLTNLGKSSLSHEDYKEATFSQIFSIDQKINGLEQKKEAEQRQVKEKHAADQRKQHDLNTLRSRIESLASAGCSIKINSDANKFLTAEVIQSDLSSEHKLIVRNSLDHNQSGNKEVFKVTDFEIKKDVSARRRSTYTIHHENNNSGGTSSDDENIDKPQQLEEKKRKELADLLTLTEGVSQKIAALNQNKKAINDSLLTNQDIIDQMGGGYGKNTNVWSDDVSAQIISIPSTNPAGTFGVKIGSSDQPLLLRFKDENGTERDVCDEDFASLAGILNELIPQFNEIRKANYQKIKAEKDIIRKYFEIVGDGSAVDEEHKAIFEFNESSAAIDYKLILGDKKLNKAEILDGDLSIKELDQIELLLKPVAEEITKKLFVNKFKSLVEAKKNIEAALGQKVTNLLEDDELLFDIGEDQKLSFLSFNGVALIGSDPISIANNPNSASPDEFDIDACRAATQKIDEKLQQASEYFGQLNARSTHTLESLSKKIREMPAEDLDLIGFEFADNKIKSKSDGSEIIRFQEGDIYVADLEIDQTLQAEVQKYLRVSGALQKLDSIDQQIESKKAENSQRKELIEAIRRNFDEAKEIISKYKPTQRKNISPNLSDKDLVSINFEDKILNIFDDNGTLRFSLFPQKSAEVSSSRSVSLGSNQSLLNQGRRSGASSNPQEISQFSQNEVSLENLLAINSALKVSLESERTNLIELNSEAVKENIRDIAKLSLGADLRVSKDESVRIQDNGKAGITINLSGQECIISENNLFGCESSELENNKARLDRIESVYLELEHYKESLEISLEELKEILENGFDELFPEDINDEGNDYDEFVEFGGDQIRSITFRGEPDTRFEMPKDSDLASIPFVTKTQDSLNQFKKELKNRIDSKINEIAKEVGAFEVYYQPESGQFGWSQSNSNYHLKAKDVDEFELTTPIDHDDKFDDLGKSYERYSNLVEIKEKIENTREIAGGLKTAFDAIIGTLQPGETSYRADQTIISKETIGDEEWYKYSSLGSTTYFRIADNNDLFIKNSSKSEIFKTTGELRAILTEIQAIQKARNDEVDSINLQAKELRKNQLQQISDNFNKIVKISVGDRAVSIESEGKEIKKNSISSVIKIEEKDYSLVREDVQLQLRENAYKLGLDQSMSVSFSDSESDEDIPNRGADLLGNNLDSVNNALLAILYNLNRDKESLVAECKKLQSQISQKVFGNTSENHTEPYELNGHQIFKDKIITEASANNSLNSSRDSNDSNVTVRSLNLVPLSASKKEDRDTEIGADFSGDGVSIYQLSSLKRKLGVIEQNINEEKVELQRSLNHHLKSLAKKPGSGVVTSKEGETTKYTYTDESNKQSNYAFKPGNVLEINDQEPALIEIESELSQFEKMLKGYERQKTEKRLGQILEVLGNEVPRDNKIVLKNNAGKILFLTAEPVKDSSGKVPDYFKKKIGEENYFIVLEGDDEGAVVDPRALDDYLNQVIDEELREIENEGFRLNQSTHLNTQIHDAEEDSLSSTQSADLNTQNSANNTLDVGFDYDDGVFDQNDSWFNLSNPIRPLDLKYEEFLKTRGKFIDQKTQLQQDVENWIKFGAKIGPQYLSEDLRQGIAELGEKKFSELSSGWLELITEINQEVQNNLSELIAGINDSSARLDESEKEKLKSRFEAVSGASTTDPDSSASYYKISIGKGAKKEDVYIDESGIVHSKSGEDYIRKDQNWITENYFKISEKLTSIKFVADAVFDQKRSNLESELINLVSQKYSQFEREDQPKVNENFRLASSTQKIAIDLESQTEFVLKYNGKSTNFMIDNGRLKVNDGNRLRLASVNETHPEKIGHALTLLENSSPSFYFRNLASREEGLGKSVSK